MTWLRRHATRLERLRSAGVPALIAFSAAALGAGLGRAITTSYLPVLLADIRDAPGLIGMVMLVNTLSGFVVPLWVGVWSDRLRSRGHGRTVPFILGGSLLAAGGLVAIALGSTSTYGLLALFGAVCYTGLNAITTAHRALIPDNFQPDRRARATGAEEFAMLAGALAGIVVGGALVEIRGWAPFAFAAAAIPLLAVPTVLRMRSREHAAERSAPEQREPIGYYLRIARRPGVRLVLAAQVLWVLGYLALPTFFVLYAERVLGLRPSIAALMLAGAGIVTGVTMLAAGLATERWFRPLLMLGVLLMGCGLMGMAPASEAALAAPGIVVTGIGFGIVSTVGFPLLTRYVPAGEEGSYTALYFSVRSVASAIAVPVAGWVIAISGSYRALPVLGGAVTLLALLPLSRLAPLGRPGWPDRARFALARDSGALRRPRLEPTARLVGGLALLFAIALGVGAAIEHSPLAGVDEAIARRIVGGVDGPAALVAVLDGFALANYLVLAGLGLALAPLLRRPPITSFVLVAVSGLLAWGVIRALWALWDRARPEEVLGIETVRIWAHVPSYPSGHVAVTVAMVAALAFLYPRARVVFWAYAAAIVVTRFLFGAHFPSDVVTGIVIGYACFALVRAALAEVGAALSVTDEGEAGTGSVTEQPVPAPAGDLAEERPPVAPE